MTFLGRVGSMVGELVSNKVQWSGLTPMSHSGKPRIFAAVNLEHNLVAKSTPQDQELFKELVELEAKRAEEQIKWGLQR